MLNFIKKIIIFAVFLTAIAVVGRVFFFKIVRTDSYSMIPNLVAGDYFLVFTRAILGPGSVAACRNPEDPSSMVVLRIEGVPGSTFAIRNNNLVLNGRIQQQQSTGHYLYVDNNSTEYLEYDVGTSEEYIGGHRYDIALMQDGGDQNFPSQEVEEGFFLVGDNRNMAYDSRNFGDVSIESCIGGAFLILWPGPDSGDFKRLRRILKWID